MKNFLITLATALFLLLPAESALAATIITTPIDGRPISNEYLKNLTDMAGDTFVTSEQRNLDYFSDVASENHFANSKAIRDELRKNVSKNNGAQTTVIINSSTYFTGGLVGSRCFKNYEGYEQGLKELYDLITKHPEPTYYVNIAMPRNLPETRNNEIWPNDERIRGMAYYYDLEKREYPGKEYIQKTFLDVTPTQFLMEWSYVENKRDEMGINALEEWEKKYLSYAEVNYWDKKYYRDYMQDYKNIFAYASQMLESIFSWQKSGLIDEVIIGNDDFQLPEFIVYCYEGLQERWIPLENASPIKFSFARTYMTSGKDSAYQRITRNYNELEAELAYQGRSKNVNYVFGMDEIPQLIYARDLSKRRNLTANMEILGLRESKAVGTYDVLNPAMLLENTKNFVAAGRNTVDKEFSLFVCDYTEAQTADFRRIGRDMTEKYNEKDNVGLIELYNYSVLEARNDVLKELLTYSAENNGRVGADRLACYSAWNTNANAIGLGIAQAQVYAIMEQETKEPKEFLSAHLRTLSQRILEDGYYTPVGKRVLSSKGYKPTAQDRAQSETVKDTFDLELVEKALEGKFYHAGERIYQLEDWQLKKYTMPWRRLFDCYIEVAVSLSQFGR